eukprot:GHUV01018875.1.p1 GENE.GHUV01018875.1~~GHUV01018875.1.p1  ORF type:complete len:299 (+),score=72.19 GHUV01018875.1:565-1461(+)
MTDDKGKICPAGDLDWTTGCCSAGEQHSCSKCNELDSCCDSFEHCVSCCMNPKNKPEERRKETFKAPNNKESGFWADNFEYCLAACRTHGRSTSHENAYIGARHHCFSKLGKPMLSPPLPPGSLDGVTVVLSASGASCSTMCQQQGLTCSQKHLHFLNSCDRLREVINCEAGCEVETFTSSMPAAVDPEAPKASRPALCLVGKNPPEAQFSCEATANYMRRLCSCVQGGTPGAEGSTQVTSRAIPVGDAATNAGAFEETAAKVEQEDEQTAADAADTADGDGSSAQPQLANAGRHLLS